MSGCHSYSEHDLPTYFHTTETTPIVFNAIQHKNGVRILSEVPSAHKLLVEGLRIKEQVQLVAEEGKVDGFYAYRYDFNLHPEERVTLKPISETMLFNPVVTKIVGATDCVDVSLLKIFVLF